MDEVLTLQRADELPSGYRDALDALNLLPAWTLLRAVMPVGGAAPKAMAAQWSYAKLRPLLLRAAELVPMEKAERRVLGYINPGLERERLSTLPSIFFGLQLIMPGERAPNHKHIPAAARIIIEGEGAYTTVDGEKLARSRTRRRRAGRLDGCARSSARRAHGCLLCAAGQNGRWL